MLAVGVADPESLDYLARGARFHARASWFGMCSLAQILSAYKSQLHGQPGHDRLSLAPTLATAWLYWGTEQADADACVDSSSVPHHAQSSYVPPSAIRNLGAKRVEFPFTVLQSRPDGYQARHDPEFGPFEPRFHLRSVYFDRDCAVGAGISGRVSGVPIIANRSRLAPYGGPPTRTRGWWWGIPTGSSITSRSPSRRRRPRTCGRA